MDRGARQFIPISLWAVVAVVLIYLVSIDLYNQEQFVLGVAFLATIYILRARYMRTLDNAKPLRLTRLLLLVLAGLMALRYLIWRVQYSIPWYNDKWSLALSLVLLAAEVFAVLLYFMGAFTVIHPLRREPVPLDLERDDLPTVDVFIPSYNESADLLRTTLLAASSIEYPKDKLNIYLLDDGGTTAKCEQSGDSGRLARQRKTALRALCEETGAQYLTREHNHHAKAGNINAALKETHGQVILVLDSDHIPTMDFLKLTIGTMMSDPTIALVQTPHYTINQDPFENSLHATHKMPAEGDMFYSLNLRGMDNWNAGFFCGSGALILRTALERIGGICTDTIVEDADSSMELLSQGYKTAYLHTPALAGLNSESIDALVVQRSRWATGMIQLFRMKNPLFRKGLSFAQRLCYLNCIAYWFFPLARVVFLLTPIMALLFGVVFFSAPPSEILLYVTPYLVGLYMVLNVMYGRVRWSFVSDLYDTITAVLLAGTVFATLINPKHKEFKVTPKAVTRESASLSFLSKRFYLLIAIQIGAAILGISTMLHDPTMFNQIMVSLAWNAYNMIFTIAALGALIERGEIRHRPRVAVDEYAELQLGSQSIPCHVEDMTEDGLMLHMPKEISSIEGGKATLKLLAHHSTETFMEVPVRIRNTHGKSVKKEQHLMVGLSFEYEGISQRRKVINYLYGHSKRWQADLVECHQHSTMTQGVLFVIKAFAYGLIHIGLLITLPFKRKKTIKESSL
jgi:cellulose synthase (UDP-forming)